MPVSAPDLCEAELWNLLRHGRDSHARAQLFSRHALWARGIALGVHRRLWGYAVERSDCIQNATVGLLDAMDRYDPARGVEFRAYASSRVRGAVFNGLRAQIGSHPAGAPVLRLCERMGHLSGSNDMEPVDDLIDTVVGLGLGLMLESAHEALVDECDGFMHAQASQLNTRLLASVHGLSGRHRELVEAHYFNYVPFCEIARQWGVSRGRVSQLHKEALSRLRARVHAHGT